MKKNWLFSSILTAILLLLFVLGDSSIFKIDKIAVLGNQEISAEEIQDRLASILNQDLLLLDVAEVKLELLKERRIDQVQVDRTWPNQLTIRIKEKEPVLLIDSRPVYGLTRQGEILPVDSLPKGLTLIKGIPFRALRPYTVPVLPELEQVLRLYQAFRSQGYSLSELADTVQMTKDSEFVLGLSATQTTVFLSQADYLETVSRLVEILRAEPGQPASIDLRYENLAVVSYHR
jgi:cell division septal protein FtsQ